MRSSQYPEAAFLATMTASSTHEVRNVLAIIKESAGLIEDMVQVFSKRGTLDQEKLCRAVDRIDVQVKRAADLLTHLNRLSHTLDQDVAEVELSKEVEQVVYLSQRFARKKGHRVVAGEGGAQVSARVSGLRLQMVLFSAMECCLDELPEGAAISVEVQEKGAAGGGPVVEFRGAPGEGRQVGRPSDSEAWGFLVGQAAAIGAAAVRCEEGFGIRILFPQGTGG